MELVHQLAALHVCLTGFVDKKDEMTVKLLGGDLKIKWEENVYMTGPAKIVFEGELDESVLEL